MVSLIQDATQAMVTLHNLTSALKHGSTPDAHTILGIQSDLVDFYRQVGEEMATKFGAKEAAYLSRKIAQAQQYQKARIELKMTGGDSAEAAMLAVAEEYSRENENATEYERYRTFLRSIQNAIEHTRQTVSFLKTAENSPS